MSTTFCTSEPIVVDLEGTFDPLAGVTTLVGSTLALLPLPRPARGGQGPGQDDPARPGFALGALSIGRHVVAVQVTPPGAFAQVVGRETIEVKRGAFQRVFKPGAKRDSNGVGPQDAGL